jgi:hypothetical protein
VLTTFRPTILKIYIEEFIVKYKIQMYLLPVKLKSPSPHTAIFYADNCSVLKVTITYFTALTILVTANGVNFNPLNAKLNPICHLLALLGGATIVVVSRLRVNVLGLTL